MGEKGQKLLDSLTGGQDIQTILLKSLILAFLSALFSLPYLYYMLSVANEVSGGFPGRYAFDTVIKRDIALLFLACFLSSIAGFTFSRKQNLPGLGDIRRFKETLPYLLAVGAVIGFLTMLFFDRNFYQISPLSYPKEILYIVSYPFKLAFMNEVILRLGLVTLAVGLLKHRLGGVITVSGLAAVFTMKYFRFFGIDCPYNFLFITQFVIAFCMNFILGYVFITRGLIYAMTLNFMFGLRLPMVLWLLG